MHQITPAAELLEPTGDSSATKQPWEPPALEVLPLSETLASPGGGNDGIISSAS